MTVPPSAGAEPGAPGGFTVGARDGRARTATLRTLHGDVLTPAFMPVGTQASVKALHPLEVRSAGAQIILANAYHLALRPGVEVVEALGGLHRFMAWDGPILTDSGGYQLLSLAEVAAVDDEAATFISPYDGSRLRVSPEMAVALQHRLGADIIMCLDHPVSWDAAPALASEATERTHRWAERCRSVHPGGGRLLFGIVQGGFDPCARRESARRVAGLGFDGLAIGGLSVGEPTSAMVKLTADCTAELPEDLPRYFMGLGTDRELVALVEQGVDMFDCVIPTRLARNGTALVAGGRLSLRQAAFREDPRPVEAGCPCACCRDFSRAYLRHLFAAGEILAHRLLSLHNITHLCSLMAEVRRAIQAGSLAELRDRLESEAGRRPEQA
ncbi:MAG TPA: tRNA guanosine(34) transglycosylase Tgt [Candidatus Binatia bacterium]|nr:tRNA guanosine(34) transglycosylase Tgt [Candidatus Binatia bacterium]